MGLGRPGEAWPGAQALWAWAGQARRGLAWGPGPLGLGRPGQAKPDLMPRASGPG
eukprot:NODE_733_length_1822_cov_15.116751_g596_i0.p7 GENE.NODE_733_length_1822_cov_15.116751_g596_i0~~NODE_733_length_1822_cov_15.116751_g596_i0.p7  ORF type:complete len:55 (-),score=0.77 NODE_733_length_1822_cov_15.116751_g596_i0:684-848(-)